MAPFSFLLAALALALPSHAVDLDTCVITVECVSKNGTIYKTSCTKFEPKPGCSTEAVKGKKFCVCSEPQKDRRLGGIAISARVFQQPTNPPPPRLNPTRPAE